MAILAAPNASALTLPLSARFGIATTDPWPAHVRRQALRRQRLRTFLLAQPSAAGLTVDYDPASGLVKLGGTATSPEAMEKAVLIAGNAMGVSNVNVDAMKNPGESAGVEYYIIKSGDTLSAIALRFYKDANKYPRIFEANREVIKDPNLIFPGQKIRIPPA